MKARQLVDWPNKHIPYKNEANGNNYVSYTLRSYLNA